MAKKTKRGRPTMPEGEKAVRVLITLRPDLDAIAKKLGNGNRSKGIEIALTQSQTPPLA